MNPMRRPGILRDLIFAIACVVVAIGMAYAFDVGESWRVWTNAHQSWGLAELPFAITLTAGAAVWISIRQWHGLRRQNRQAQQLIADLQKTTAEQSDMAADLRASENRFRDFVENLPVSIVVKDLDGTFVLVNREFLSCYDLSLNDVIGKTDYDICTKDEADVFTRQDREVEASGKPRTREIIVIFSDGQAHIVSVTKFPIFDTQGHITAIGSMGLDVTDQRRTEERLAQAQKMETVGQLTGGIAHDFNNLLAVIQGNVELIEMQGDADIRDLVAPVQRAARRGAELTQRLLAYSRRQSLAPRIFDPVQRIDGILLILQRTLGKNIVTRTDMAVDLWPVIADPSQVENAILNLAINARDAMPEGGSLTIGCRNQRIDAMTQSGFSDVSPGEYVVISVTDTGTGMPPKVMARAFEPFFTTKDVGKGSGLGLSMIYGFTKQSGGHVTIESESGHGSTIHMYLPRAHQKPTSPVRAENSKVPTSSGESILVIEDDDDVRNLTVSMLRTLGYQVQSAATTNQASTMLDGGRPPDILLSDIVLAGSVSGPVFAAGVRKIHPDIKVVYMSGYAEDSPQTAALHQEGGRMLRKPFQMWELAQAVREVVD